MVFFGSGSGHYVDRFRDGIWLGGPGSFGCIVVMVVMVMVGGGSSLLLLLLLLLLLKLSLGFPLHLLFHEEILEILRVEVLVVRDERMLEQLLGAGPLAGLLPRANVDKVRKGVRVAFRQLDVRDLDLEHQVEEAQRPRSFVAVVSSPASLWYLLERKSSEGAFGGEDSDAPQICFRNIIVVK